MEPNDPAPPHDYLRLARLVFALSRRFSRGFDAAFRPELDLDFKATVVLRAVESGVRSPSGVSEHLRLPPSSVSRLLEKLEGRGLLRRELDPDDYRRFRLELTNDGAATLERARAVVAKTLHAAYGDLPAGTIGGAIDTLRLLEGTLADHAREEAAHGA